MLCFSGLHRVRRPLPYRLRVLSTRRDYRALFGYRGGSWRETIAGGNFFFRRYCGPNPCRGMPRQFRVRSRCPGQVRPVRSDHIIRTAFMHRA